MAQAECGRGHLYDSDIYSKCPYCNGERKSIVFGGANENAAEIGKTVPGGMAAADTTFVTHIMPASTGEPEAIGVTVPGGAATQKPESEIGTTTFIGPWGSVHNVKPTVGWLVCFEGPEKGKDFRLHAGNNNSIGRSEMMDICIRRDDAVSEEYQARVAYDEKFNSFYFIPGEKSTNINYLNGDPVFGQKKLEAYDVIEFGESKFHFVPYCCDKFVWSKEKKAEMVK